MKKVTAYLKPFKLEQIIAGLPAEGVHEVLVSEVRGYGRQKGHLEQYRGNEYEFAFVPKARLEVYCEDDAVAAIEKVILEGARTGRIGDGKITIALLEQSAQF